MEASRAGVGTDWAGLDEGLNGQPKCTGEVSGGGGPRTCSPNSSSPTASSASEPMSRGFVVVVVSCVGAGAEISLARCLGGSTKCAGNLGGARGGRLPVIGAVGGVRARGGIWCRHTATTRRPDRRLGCGGRRWRRWRCGWPRRRAERRLIAFRPSRPGRGRAAHQARKEGCDEEPGEPERGEGRGHRSCGGPRRARRAPGRCGASRA